VPESSQIASGVDCVWGTRCASC